MSSSASTTSGSAASGGAGANRRYAHANINVRARPSAQSAIVDTIYRGATVQVLADSGDWAQVTGGFVRQDLLKYFPLPPLSIETSSWYKDPDFAMNGAVIWTAVVRNNTNEYVERAMVEFTSYDAAENIVDTDFSFATGLRPGGTASVKGYATYFGTEKTARIAVKD